MSSILESYCDVAESMAFISSEMRQSVTFGEAIHKPILHNRLKCFNCFGMPDKQEYCSHCGGTNFVTDQHPLALLLNDVFQRKLGKTAHTKDAVRTEYQFVEPIKEQQEEFDQRKIICDLCNKECGNNYMYICECCDCFYVCVKCAKQKEQKGEDIDHEHPFAKNKNLHNPLFSLKRTNSNHYDSDEKHQANNSLREKNGQKKNDGCQQEKLLTGQYFNVSDIIEKQISHTYGNVAQNISCVQSESIEEGDFGVGESLEGYSFKLSQLQGSDKGVKMNRQIYEMVESLTRSVIPPSSSNSYFLQTKTSIPTKQSIDFSNLIPQQESPTRKSFDGRESFGFNYGNYDQEHCNNCGGQLKDVYSICRTCQKNDINYKICSQCDDRKVYQHDKNHMMEMMLGNLLGRNSEMTSKDLIDSDKNQDGDEDQNEDEDEQTNNLYIQIPKLSKKRSSLLEKRPPRLDQSPFDQSLSGNKSFSKLKSLASIEIAMNFRQKQHLQQQKVSKFDKCDKQSIVNLDCQGLFESTDLSHQPPMVNLNLVHKKSSLYEVNNSMENIPHPNQFTHAKNKSKVGFAQIGSDDEQLHIEYVQSEPDEIDSPRTRWNNKHEEVTIKSSRSSYKDFKGVKSMIISKHQVNSIVSESHETHEQQVKYSQSSMRFSRKSFGLQYQSQMIDQNTQTKQKLEYIFHGYCCDECGIAPIKNIRYHCEECENFDVCENCYGVAMKSRHNHRFEKIDGLKKLLDKKNMMLQKKDLNKGRESVLRSSNNIRMLTNTKKTMEFINKRIQQFESTISNFEKSSNFYSEFFNQKFSFKTKVQYY